jgi:hypothetical protein
MSEALSKFLLPEVPAKNNSALNNMLAKPNSVNVCNDIDATQIDTPHAQVARKMPKRKKRFGRSQKRGGNSKLGAGGEGLEFFPSATPTCVALAVTPVAKLSSKVISKRNLLSQLQQMEVRDQLLIDLLSYSFLSSNLRSIVDRRLNANS